MVNEMDDNELARIRNREIGFVLKSFNLLARASASITLNFLLFTPEYPRRKTQRARDALKSVDLEPRMFHKPNELSGGQRQRVAIARALVNKPAILLADEPTGALDSTTGAEIMALFEELYEKGNTIVLVTHELDIASHAHRIIHIRDGRVDRDEAVRK